MLSFVPVQSIPYLYSRNVGSLYASGIRAKEELWRIAVGAVADPSDVWCEFGVGEGESFDWFCAAKPERNRLVGFDSFEGIPEPWLRYPAGQWRTTPYRPTAPDVSIVLGAFEESLRRPETLGLLTDRIGLLHVDCDLYSSTRCVFDTLGDRIVAGTVVIFDEFLNYEEWHQHEAKAFHEFVQQRGVSFDYLARTDWQLAVQLTAVGVKPSWSIRPLDPSTLSPVIAVDYGSELTLS
jgi:hypothetical protein